MRKQGIKFAAMALAMAAAIVAGAAPKFTVDGVLQRYPWSNTVDIRYTVSGLAEGKKSDIAFKARIDGGEPVDATNATVAANGTYTQQWTPPEGVWCTNCTVSGVMTPVLAPYTPGDYMIVNLRTGAISYESDSPSAKESPYNTDEYKTTNMVFRKIAAASGVHLQTNKIDRTWTFPSDYYIGVFPVTVAQYAFMTNASANIASMGEDGLKPMNKISWQTIRGSATDFNSIPGIGHATTSNQCCISVLNRRVRDCNSQGTAKAKFDLPTEAAWEYAAAAGTSGTQAYFFGETYRAGAGLVEYAWYGDNSGYASTYSESRHPVGGKWANPWGLYDVYGNVSEWCRDRYVDGNLTKEMPASGFTAASSDSHYFRRARGGGYRFGASSCSSVYRDYNDWSFVPSYGGFRLSWGCVP